MSIFLTTHSWHPFYQTKSFFDHKLILSQTSLKLIWIHYRIVFEKVCSDGLALGGNCAWQPNIEIVSWNPNKSVPQTPVGAALNPNSTLNPINQACTTNGSVPVDLHKASQGYTSLPGSLDLPEWRLVLEAEFLNPEVFLKAGAEMVMPLCKRLRYCVFFTVIVIAIVSKATSVGCFERILLHSGLAFWH